MAHTASNCRNNQQILKGCDINILDIHPCALIQVFGRYARQISLGDAILFVVKPSLVSSETQDIPSNTAADAPAVDVEKTASCSHASDSDDEVRS